MVNSKAFLEIPNYDGVWYILISNALGKDKDDKSSQIEAILFY